MGSFPIVEMQIFSGLVAAVLAYGGWRRRDVAGGRAFTVMMVAIVIWTLGDAAQLSVSTTTGYRFWGLVNYVGPVVTPVAGFLFVLTYTGRDHWMTPKLIGFLSVIPAFVYLARLTNPYHGLVLQYTGELMTDPIANREVVVGPVLALHITYIYGLLVLTLGLLVAHLLRVRGPYRWQTFVMILGGTVPFAANLVWLLGVSPLPGGKDPTGLSFVVTGVLFAVGLYSFDLLDLAPVARRTVIEKLTDAVVTIDANGRIVDANPAARNLLADGSPLVGEPARAVVPRYDSISSSVDHTEEVVVDTAHGRRYCDARTSLLHDDAGEVVGRVVLLRDVTERRLVEKRHQLLIENASDIVLITEPDGTITYVSPSVGRLLGYDPGEIMGTDATSYVHPDDHETLAEQMHELVETPQEEFRAQYRTRTADGEWRAFEARGRNLLDDPVVGGVVFNCRDVTERQERERRLQRQNKQLEEFTAVISHDLRNPLSVAHGYAQLIAEGHDDEEHVERLVQAHGRMKELLDDLLTLAREGREVGETGPVELATAASRAWGSVDTADATLVVEEEITVAADDTRLRELLENLFANAVRFAGDDALVRVGPLRTTSARTDTKARAVAGGGSATDDEGMSSSGGDTLVGFYVVDDGPGIPEDRRSTVFEAGKTGKDGETGLGLTIVKRIAEAHSWKATVTEGKDGGARFEFKGVEFVE